MDKYEYKMPNNPKYVYKMFTSGKWLLPGKVTAELA